MTQENNVQALLEKWADVIDYPGLPEVKDKYRRETLAVMLENQNQDSGGQIRKDPHQSLTYLLTENAPTNSMGASSSTPGTGHVDIFDPVLISLVRRSMPNLIAYDICGVQPMSMPTGLIFALRSRYSSQDGLEALF